MISPTINEIVIKIANKIPAPNKFSASTTSIARRNKRRKEYREIFRNILI
jgi:hypothetical protein